VDHLEAIAYSNSVVEVVPIHTVLMRDQTRQFDVKHASIHHLMTQFGELLP
jgi:hypothetical protein